MHPPLQFQRVSGFVLALALFLAGAAAPVQAGIKSTLVAGGFNRPVLAITPPDDVTRLFVVEQGGVIRLVRQGQLLPTPFLDINPIVGGGGAGDERGLLGLAFHPNYVANRRFYVSYTDNSGASVVREYKTSPTNPDVADSSTFTTIVGPVSRSAAYHNGGCLEFGLDRMLYLSLGDGTQSLSSQSQNTYLGKMLRIDVDNAPSFVPAGNPFAGGNFPLIWSTGWRNPWRFSFDRATGDLYAGDVGDGLWEEIDFQSAVSNGAENYGWPCMEGNHCTSSGGCTCNGPNLRRPIHEYHHSMGCSIVGGYVYRGAAIPALVGHYLYADFCTNKVWSFIYNGSQVSNLTDRTAELDPPGPEAIANIVSFGQDANGELYICTLSGSVYRIDSTCPEPVNYCVTSPNSAGAGAVMRASGTSSLSNNDLTLRCVGCPRGVNGFFLYGSQRAHQALGNGFLCVGGQLRRLPVIQTNQTGAATWSFDAAGSPANITVGSKWDFQFYFRDVPGGGALFDLSDGLEVTFCH